MALLTAAQFACPLLGLSACSKASRSETRDLYCESSLFLSVPCRSDAETCRRLPYSRCTMRECIDCLGAGGSPVGARVELVPLCIIRLSLLLMRNLPKRFFLFFLFGGRSSNLIRNLMRRERNGRSQNGSDG